MQLEKRNAFNRWSQAFIYQTRKFLKYVEAQTKVASILGYIKLDIIYNSYHHKSVRAVVLE